MGWTSVVAFPAETGILHLCHLVKTGSGAHPASYAMDIGGKAAGSWNWPLISIQCRR